LIAYGVTLAAMNLLFYEALERTPLGVAVTVEFIGPLSVALVGSRRPRDLVIALLAAGGIVLLARGGGTVSILGLVLAALAGLCWAAYIVISARVGARLPGTGPLAIAMVIAALASLPFGADGAVHASGHALLLGLVIGLLSSTIPYALELEALRRLPQRVFGILMSLEPAVAALAGLLVLSEHLAGRQWAGIGCVIIACALATAQARRGPGDSGSPRGSPIRHLRPRRLPTA
jgi:threonine/homoserine efflux transporter RhtA